MKRREFLAASAGVAGSLVPLIGGAQVKPCPPPSVSVQGGQSATTACVVGNAEADWQSRISGSGVVWFHDFRSDAEVNAFRWTPAYNSGNDPLAKGSANAKLTRRITTDGITGACLEIVRPAGSSDGSVWWRPFAPIVGSGNGRGQNDPAAGGTVPVRSYAATDGGSQISAWSQGAYYGTSGSGPFDGPEYYFQCRVKMDPARIQGANASIDVGKLFYFTRTDRSATDQEIVVFSGHPIGGKNYFSMYRSVGPPLDADAPGVSARGNQPGNAMGTVGNKQCRFDNDGGRLANCWYWPVNEWATVMWHIKNGTSGGNNTLIEAWAARQGEKQFTKIWYQPDADLPFDPDFPQGHNALIASIYHNGENMPVQFYHRYCQMIFSKQPIACPQV